jgi:lactate dehydrogenase-like 2-hydroxyacid dehydrogenase
MRKIMAEDRAHKVLICDPVGLRLSENGTPDISEVSAFVMSQGGVLHLQGETNAGALTPNKIHFFYLPHLSRAQDILDVTQHGQYDAVIAAATFLPPNSKFKFGGVRIGAGTGNMACSCWGGGNGVGGTAPLMNTPSFNSRATAQMVFKALLRFMPDLPLDELHRLSVEGHFDTGKNLAAFPTEKLEGKTMAVLGYGNIGREVALLAQAFHMTVKIYARPKHREWILSEGFHYAETPQSAAHDADVLSVHVGLGTRDPVNGRYANEAFVNADILKQLRRGACVINFDRGECVDANALGEAMAEGRVRIAAIDADIFQNQDGVVSGPLAPYLFLATTFKDRVLLLPHAAADTCHTSRVEGAKQAVTQIIDCILHRRVTNLKGDLPVGFIDGGPKTVKGIGKVQPSLILDMLANHTKSDAIFSELQTMIAIWSDLKLRSPKDRHSAVFDHGENFIKSINTYVTLMKQMGLSGPFWAKE